MKRRFILIMGVVAGMLLTVFMTGQAYANPRYGAECQYCHASSPPDETAAVEILGTTQELDGLPLLTVAPGGSVELGFHVTAGDPSVYYLALRALDTLNAPPEPEEPNPAWGEPRLYTPDASWSTSAATGEQYIYWFGQYYVTPLQLASGDFTFDLTLSGDVAPGNYQLMATAGGGFPYNEPGGHPDGGWAAQQDFILQVIPEPGSFMLIVLGLLAACFFARRRVGLRPAVLSLAALLLAVSAADDAQAYPSRGVACWVCHGRTSPVEGDADYEILNADSAPTTLFEVEPGGSTEFVFEITDLPLVDPPTDPPTYERFYLILDGLDYLNVGPTGDAADIPYSPMLYTAPDVDFEGGDWHSHRGDHRYTGPNGSYYAISDNVLLSIPFRLTLDAAVMPGDYLLEAQLVGGAPHAGEGWDIIKEFTLRVTSSRALALAADFDADGDVDGDDFLVWQSGFGSDAGGDADGDGDTDGDDFLVWQSEFGASPGGNSAAAIPEPGSLALVALLGLVLAANGVRKRRG